jgi:hypothetical protein
MAKDSQDYKDGLKDAFNQASKSFRKLSELSSLYGQRYSLMIIEKIIQAHLERINESIKVMEDKFAKEGKPNLRIIKKPEETI